MKKTGNENDRVLRKTTGCCTQSFGLARTLKFQCGYELFATLCIVVDSDLPCIDFYQAEANLVILQVVQAKSFKKIKQVFVRV